MLAITAKKIGTGSTAHSPKNVMITISITVGPMAVTSLYYVTVTGYTQISMFILSFLY